VDPVPTIDVSALAIPGRDIDAVATELDAACRGPGVFTIVGHGVDRSLIARLERVAHEFFALDDGEKSEIAMARGGRAWRGWFPLGGELTSGVADRKEGVYFGAELATDDPRVVAGRPMHGPNLFPSRPAAMRATVLAYLDALTALGHRVVLGIARGLGLDADWFRRELTADPVVLFRIFRYPPTAGDAPGWGVAEHTDYGLLTLLHQDGRGLEVRVDDRWVEVEPVDGGIVCNLGDMLELMTGGTYRSTPHRVRNRSGRDRLSFPFFFDPSWDARMRPVPGMTPVPEEPARWDGRSVFDVTGTYGEYLTAKVAKVFPALRDEALDGG